MKTGQKVDAQKEELKQVEAYCFHHKLVELLARNKLMVADLTKRLADQQSGGQQAATNRRPLRPDDLVHMYETLIENLQELCDLPGNDTDEEQYGQWTAEVAGFRAFR